MENAVWITWERQPRNLSVAKLMDASYFEFDKYSMSIIRYPYNIYKTLLILTKPSVKYVFVQNPSLVLSLLAAIVLKVFRKNLIIDAHNGGVRPLEGRYQLLQKLNLWILKQSDVVIVTNSLLAEYLTEKDISAFVLPDPLPEVSFHRNSDELPQIDVFVICSWSEDEPIEAYLEAARNRPDLIFGFSGNYKKYREITNLPNNVKLLGFISENSYRKMLHDVTLIIDMTTQNDCLVCGAYEAIAAGTPVLLSDTSVSRELFLDAATYAACNQKSILAGIDEILKDQAGQKTRISNFRDNYKSDILKKSDDLTAFLEKESK